MRDSFRANGVVHTLKPLYYLQMLMFIQILSCDALQQQNKQNQFSSFRFQIDVLVKISIGSNKDLRINIGWVIFRKKYRNDAVKSQFPCTVHYARGHQFEISILIILTCVTYMGTLCECFS